MHFGWAHDFWRRMGWGEFRAHLAAMNRHKQGQTSHPDSWEGAEQDPWWREARAQRDRTRGRG